MDEEQQERQPREETPFDDNPPVDPSEPQVGNSRARFFMPRDDESGQDGEEDAEDAEEDEQHGDAGDEGGESAEQDAPE